MNSSASTIYPESLETNRESGGESSLSNVKSTSIGSVVVRSGPIQMLIALLQSGDLYFIKVVEVQPKLTTLGNNIDEAVGQQRDHDELLKQLQNMPTPVEEFVQKADKLLAARKANPHVLDAMGQTLNIAWEDILKLLHDRKHLLDLCANFHEKMGACRGKMASLEVACKDTMIPIEIEAVQEFLNVFKQLRIDVLTAVMSALKDGNELLARLQDMAQSGTLDSRPDHVRKDAMRAINQVQQWLEELHDRRNSLEAAWTTRKTQLEQCLALAILAKDLDELEAALINQRNMVSGVYSLGECEHTSNQYLREYIGYKQDALLLRDKGVKITRATEKLVAGGCFAGDEACSRAYAVLSSCTEHLEQVDQREHWLHQSKDFFGKAEKTLSVLERLEIDLSTLNIASDSPEAFAMYAKILNDLKVLTEEPLRLGYAILDEVGRTKPETQGVKRVLDEIENRKIYLEKICSASTEQQVMVTQALTEFMEEYNQLLSWLVSIAEAFLQSNNSLGKTLDQSRSFLHLHHKLMQDLERKGEEINMLLTKIKKFLNSLDAKQRYDVDTKVESLQKHWIEIKDYVFKRYDLVSIYIEFLEKAEKLSEMFEYVEKKLKETPEEQKLTQLESVWGDIKGAYGNLKAIGLRFLNVKVADPYLETKTACSHVEEILNSFSNRQFDITSSWEKWTTNIIEKREVEILWEKIMNENIEILNQATKLDAQLYPVLTPASNDPGDLLDHTRRKLNDVLQDIERAQNEVLERINTTSSLQTNNTEMVQKIEQVVSNLKLIKNKLENVKDDYRTLLEQIINFLDNIIAVRQAIERYFEEKQIVSGDRAKINRDLADHNGFRESIMDKFRLLNTQCEKLIERVRVLEPLGAREHDADRIISLLEQLRIVFENNYTRKMSDLEKSQRLAKFNEEINEINSNLTKVGKQLDDIKEQQIDNSASAKTTSLAFEYFERTIELLEKRIEEFIRTTESIYATYPEAKDEIVGEVEILRERWTTFKDQVRSTRSFLNASCEYFKYLEEINDEYRAIHTFYINTSNRIPYLQSPVETSNLVNDIEKYVSSHEEPQMKRLENLKNRFSDLPGKNQITTKHYEQNVALFNSFIKLKSDLNVVLERLKNEEREREQRTREEKERLERLQRELEEKERLRKELEEQERRRREIEEKERLERLQRELEEKERLRRELEEQERQRRALEEEERLRREFEEKERLRLQLEEKERLRKELEEQERRRRELEEQERIRREFEEKERLQRELEEKERQRREREEEEHRRQYLAEQEALRRKIEEEERLLKQHEEQERLRREREEQDRIRRQAEEQEQLRRHIEEQAIIKRQIEENQRIQQQIEESQRKITQIQTKTEINEILKTEIKYSSPIFIRPLQDITIREGERITLHCQVVGSPEPTVEWFKDGISIQNNPDYRTTNEHGFCTLSIDETFTEDSARFVCRASNLVGTAETTATLSVKEQYQQVNDGMVRPTIIKYLEDAVAREGSTYQFNCVVAGNPLPTVQWFKDNVCIDDSQYYLITYNNGEANLKFEEVFLEDQATYTCKASNPAGSAECSAKLIVDPLEPTELPSFIVPLSNAMARVGQKIKLECVVAGIPAPEIFWLHNGKPYVGREVKYEGDRATLIIPEAYPKDAGVYLVTAKNIAGEAYSTCNVSVKGRLPNETSDSEMASDMEPIKPSVQLSLKDVSVFEGKSVRLDCVIVGQPEPEVIWYHNDRPVKESADVQLLFQGDRCSLVIQEAYLEDAGAYKVVAINSAGEASSSCNLSVTPLNIAEHATRTQVERLIPVESPPKFEKFLTDVLANEGETVELECSVIGDSPLTAKWYLSNRELYETDRIKNKCEPGGVFKLIISNVNADDKGVYTVKVSNSSGDAKCFSHLIVKSVNAPDSQQRPPQLEPEEKFICPTFKELFSDRNAHLDDTVKFECIVVGKPTPKIRWYFNDLPVHGKHFLVSTSGDRQVLTVQAACPETVGKIACIAENEIGKATCVANLGLIGQPVGVQQQQPSSTANVQSITEEHNTDSSLVTIKKQMFTTTSTSQISTVQNGIPQTQLHETVQRVDKDFKQFGEQKPEIVESHQYQEFRTKDSVPVAIQQKSIVVVQKSGDEMEPPPHKIVRKQIAPRFMSPLVGKIVDQGADVNLEAIYDGFPSPEIKVQKNGEDLFDTDRVKILKELNKVKINLSGVGVRDAGRYSITVTNAAGSSTSTADVVVKKTIFPPVFGHRLQAQVAKRGERVIMDVEVTGTPDPTITWYKDNKPLKEVMRSPYKLKDEGNSHTLVIEKVQTADSGKYMVKATNAGGEAQSIADFAVLEPTPERMVEVVKTVVYDDMKDFKQETSKPESSSFHTKSVETSTKSDSHGSSESTIITEHRCTTEATMRMEHKPSFLDLPVLSKPVPKPPTNDHESKSVSVSTDIVQSKFGTTQTMPQPPPKSTDEGSSIETSSITKKSAFEYFKSIQSEPVPVTEEKYTRFEDIKKPFSLPPAHPIKPTPPPERPPTMKENLPKFDLTPGAPPEYGFIPKPETVKTIDHLTDRIKKLEESQKTNIDVPSGGIKTLPEINRREEHTMYSKESTYEFSSAPIYRPQAALPTPTISGDRSPSPKPSAEGVAMEKLWASPKPFENEKIHLERDQDSQGRKQFSCTESDNEYQHTEESMRSSSIKETKQIFEEKIKQASKEEELKAPALVKQYCPPPPEPPKPIPETLLDIKLEPGPPPEICYAPKPVLERKQSLVETIEQKLEKDLEKEPAKVLPHSVRIIPPPKREVPPPLPPKDFDSPIPTTTEKRFEEVKFQSEVHRVSKPPPPTVPPKLAKGEYYESDYESDKWKFSESESDEPAYRSVKPPQFTSHPPSAVSHVPKPFVSGIQPQPVACEIPKPKPISGYIADTEESAYRKSEYHQSSSVQTSKKMYESYQQQSEPLPAKFYRHHQIRSSYPEEPVQMFPKDYSASSFTRNISMTTKNLKEVKEEEPQLEPFPFKPDPPRPRPAKVPPPPSPSKFIKGEFRESDYGSDYEEKIPPIWKPYDSDSSEPKGYRPIRPLLTPTGRRSAQSASGESPIPPTQFDNPPKFDGPPRPKFEPIKNEQPVTSQPQSQVYKPKPVQARFVPTQQQPTPQQRPNYTTQYYTAIAGTPLHNASMATETRKTVQMRESNETCNRVVNMSQTHRVIHFDNKKSSQEPPLEPFPYTASPTFTSPRPRVQLPTPTKFVPGEFRDSDFENEVDSVRIRPVWTPNPSDSEEPQYRRVNPPRPSRSSSLPRTYGRVLTPMEFDTYPPEMPGKSPTESAQSYYTNQSYKSNTMQNYSTQRTYETRTTRDDMNLKVGSPPKYNYTSQVNHQMKDFGSTLRSKSNKFVESISNDLKSTHSVRPGFKRAPSEGDNKPQAYREESRVSQYGTKHIDPDTGLVYFKYDFGYEFGIIFPGEGKKIIGGSQSKSLNESFGSKAAAIRNLKGDIVIPVQHERTSSSRSVSRQNGFTSEGEFSEPEYDGHAKKRFSLPLDINIDRLHASDANSLISRKPVAESNSTVPVNAHLLREDRPKRPPIFITPLKDIAVVMGQTARFECIVQCDPHPQITWAKNGFPLQPSNKHVIEFRNGVCRLTIPEAYPDDAATYTCQGVNELGSATTSADLLVPGNKCGIRY